DDGRGAVLPPIGGRDFGRRRGRGGCRRGDAAAFAVAARTIASESVLLVLRVASAPSAAAGERPELGRLASVGQRADERAGEQAGGRWSGRWELGSGVHLGRLRRSRVQHGPLDFVPGGLLPLCAAGLSLGVVGDAKRVWQRGPIANLTGRLMRT